MGLQVALDDKTRTIDALQNDIIELKRSLHEANEKEVQNARKSSLQERKKLNEQKKQFDDV